MCGEGVNKVKFSFQREAERERERDSERETETGRQTDRETETEKDIERQTVLHEAEEPSDGLSPWREWGRGE